MSLEQLNFEGLDKVQFSIELIQAHQPLDKYYLADSGGKDSRVLRKLCELAEAPFEAHYHTNPLDPPEITAFLHASFPDTIFDRAPMPFWKAFAKKGFPLRNTRWCCEYIKEWGGAGRTVLLGLRSEESPKRRTRCFVSYQEKGRTRFTKHTTRNVICPILLWTKEDVWEFLERYQVPYCSLYDEGASGRYKGDGQIQRIGCVMCPCATDAERLIDYYRYPKIARNWERAFERFKRDTPQRMAKFATWEEAFWWWMAPPRKSKICKPNRMEGM
jgi:phosphoadenosine phosphosulfate reductase